MQPILPRIALIRVGFLRGESVSHREYGTGYFFDHCMQTAQTVMQTGYLREKAYLATALEYDETRGQALFFSVIN